VSLPEDWRAQVVRMVTDPSTAGLASSWIAPGPDRTPAAQLDTYREQYRLRTLATLRHAYPALAARSGDRFDEMAWRYLCAHPSTTWTLGRLGDALPTWLASEVQHADWVEIAHLDLSLIHI